MSAQKVRQSGRVVGTYLHGPVLARNPSLADALLSMATGQPPPPLDDSEEEALRAERFLAVAGTQEHQVSPHACVGSPGSSDPAQPEPTGKSPIHAGHRRFKAISQFYPSNSASMPASAPASARVLVVDDEQSITDLLAMALRYEGLEVRVAHTARDASSGSTTSGHI